MKKKVIITVVMVSLFALLMWGVLIGLFDGNAIAQSNPVTLANPGFEGAYTQRENGPLFVADGWTLFYCDGCLPPHEHAQGPTVRPEYKEALASQFPERVRSGAKAQQWFSFSAVHDAGIYQRVEGVTPGSVYQFAVWSQAWSSNSDDPSESPGEMYIALGIDPQGRTDPFEVGVLWSGWQPVSGDYRQFESPKVFAEESAITVFIRTWPKWKLKHGDVYVDDASLELVTIGGTCPTPAPPATVAPCPTAGVPGECATVGEIEELLRGMTWEVRE